VTALSYAAGAIGAMLFLHEHISRQRWLGVLIVCVGVTLRVAQQALSHRIKSLLLRLFRVHLSCFSDLMVEPNRL